MIHPYFKVLILFVGLITENVIAQKNGLVDPNATPETVNLFNNLRELSKNHTLFGHQDATNYGRGWSGDEDRSDVKSVCGSHPAVIGLDIAGFSGRPANEIEFSKNQIRKLVVDMYNRGGVSTISWHFANPVSNNSFYWQNGESAPAVKHIIPGGDYHNKYKDILKVVGDWAHTLVGSDGTLAPVIFRPYHEFDGGWFWWGKPHCTKEEFITLWRFTVSFLRDSLKVHNFIYAFSPDNKFSSKKEYLERYPGNEWVDLLGIDNYGDIGRDGYKLELAAKKLKIISDIAIKENKLAAFTETGLESIPDSTWWTQTLLKTLKMMPMNICYVTVWRNDTHSKTHYYAPVPGHPSVPDFMKFYNDPYTLFLSDLKGIYKNQP